MRRARPFREFVAYYLYGRGAALRTHLLTIGISDLNVERALGGSWPLEDSKPNRVVGANWHSMFRVGPGERAVLVPARLVQNQSRPTARLCLPDACRSLATFVQLVDTHGFAIGRTLARG